RVSEADAETKRLVDAITAAIDAVPTLDADRILRMLLHAVLAVLRTNLYRSDDAESVPPCLSLKLDSAQVLELPEPRPRFEIFVASPRVDGIHLRSGYIARGGIRWSERREDFRTEVLGLMHAQVVKNTIIVPTGAKGGFVVKNPPAERDALAREVETCYRLFISALLDVTDNLVGGSLQPPSPEIVRRDAAFDHRHVFIDPTPDPEAAYEERRRLFELPASSWADYSPDRISPGGGVWPRTAKSISLSAAAQAALGVTADALPPNEVIRAILRAPVDLLWNGGVGTFVKAH